LSNADPEDDTVVPALIDALNDEDKSVREEAAKTLKQFDPLFPEKGAANRAAPSSRPPK
jgi:HEAT repeat protein